MSCQLPMSRTDNRSTENTGAPNMRYPIEVLTWVVIKINDKTVSQSILASQMFQLICQFASYANVVSYKKAVSFLRSTIHIFLTCF